MSQREAIMLALFATLQTISGPKVLRNESLPETVPPGGLLILRDGDAGEPEVMLSPLSYYWERRAEVEVIVTAAAATTRDQLLDDLITSIGAALAVDRTLGGSCDYAAAFAPQTSEVTGDGMQPFRGAIVPIDLIYTSADALG